MVGTSIFPTTGLKVRGQYGQYLVRNRIGKGGNGVVFAVDVIDGGELLPSKFEYAIKFLTVSSDDENEVEKRRRRFEKEIREVLSFQDNVNGIIPIYDSSIFCEGKQKIMWYLMPKAEKYNPNNLSVLQKLEHMKRLGKCIRQLHKLGYAHRDIKPKNLLVLDGEVRLSDFGLVWNIDSTDDHITEVNDRLGPQAIRPPELQPVENIDGIDYRKSDVYLYAKTIWMILHCNNNGFPSEYSRTIDSVYITKENFQFETAEPLHLLMEEATKHNFWERIDIDACMNHIDNQLSVIRGDVSDEMLQEWKFSEQAKHIEASIPADEKIFNEPMSVLDILNKMSKIVGLVFVEIGKEYNACPFVKARYVENTIFELEIINPYNSGKRKTIEVSIDNICMKKDLSYEIHLKTYGTESKTIPVFTNIIKALENTDKYVCLNKNCLIRMV